MKTLSIDLGRTATKACVDQGHVVLIPANVAHLTVDQTRRGGFESQPTDPLSDLWLEHQGHGYAVGHLGADFGADLGVGQSKVEDALIKTFACAGYFQLGGEIAVVAGLPFYTQDQFDREKNELESSLSGPHRMVYRGETIDINVRHVWVMPEGFGSLIWSDEKKEGEDDNFRDLSVAVVDIGHQTTDFLMVDRFRFARGASESAPYGMSKFYELVAAQIPGADSQSNTLIQAVHRPQGERFFRPKGESKPTDLDEGLPSLRKRFARELSDLLIAWLPERATDVVVCGGGGGFFWEELEPLLKEAALKAHLAMPSRESNALGQLVFGEQQVKSVGENKDGSLRIYS